MLKGMGRVEDFNMLIRFGLARPTRQSVGLQDRLALASP